MKPQITDPDRRKSKRLEAHHILGLFRRVCRERGPAIAFTHLEAGEPVSLSYAGLMEKVQRLNCYLMSQNLEPDARVAILSESRVEWPVTFFASLLSGCVTVPLDVKLSPPELVHIVGHCEPSILFVSRGHVESALALQAKVKSIRQVVVFGEGPEIAGAQLFNSIPPGAEGRGLEPKSDTTALICYTSGTSGAPKGVMISVRNLLYQIQMLHLGHHPRQGQTFLSILPLNHVFELTTGLLVVVYGGARVVYVSSLFPHELMGYFQRFEAERMVAVPMVLELFRKGIERELAKLGALKRAIVHLTLGLASLLPSHSLRRKILRPLTEKFGGHFKGFYTGGSALRPSTARFFERMGFHVYQGYGLTESSAGISLNTPAENRFGSVGRPMPGVRTRIDREDATITGEIMVAGPQIMKGYYRNPDLTRETIGAEGWLRTGDMGHVDRKGFLWVTGRKKAMIVLGGGKKVFAEEVEAAIGPVAEFAELCVLGWPETGSGMGTFELVCAVVRPSAELLRRLGEGADQASALEQKIQAKLNERCVGLSEFKKPQKTFIWLEGELPKTTTHKFKRHEILKTMLMSPNKVR